MQETLFCCPSFSKLLPILEHVWSLQKATQSGCIQQIWTFENCLPVQVYLINVGKSKKQWLENHSCVTPITDIGMCFTPIVKINFNTLLVWMFWLFWVHFYLCWLQDWQYPYVCIQGEFLVIFFTFKHFDCHSSAGSSFVNPKGISFYDLAKSSTPKRFTLKWEEQTDSFAWYSGQKTQNKQQTEFLCDKLTENWQWGEAVLYPMGLWSAPRRLCIRAVPPPALKPLLVQGWLQGHIMACAGKTHLASVGLWETPTCWHHTEAARSAHLWGLHQDPWWLTSTQSSCHLHWPGKWHWL